ncbi:MAG TPA: nuclear transport factor 2 family protein, partial [Sphingobium sp.]|uniref:nuclear transport factor 2 family protein n=1 Tax=Sphingobium sp. TaxID=1912891 RepID=UPI002ED566C0
MAHLIETAIIDAEAQRCAAMLANDLPALDALLHERLSFAHATGSLDNKPAYLAKMAAGRIDYLAIDWPEQNVVMLGEDAALLTGRMHTHVRVDGTEKALENRVTTVWLRHDDRWRLLS